MPKENIAWLDIGLQADNRAGIQDYGRLRELIHHLPAPEDQYPSLCVFLGGASRRSVMQTLFPMNNIRRHDSKAAIRLRCDHSTTGSPFPTLFADSDILDLGRSMAPIKLEPGHGHALCWTSTSSTEIFLLLCVYLIFLFTDVLCFCVAEESEIVHVINFMIQCSRLRKTHSSYNRPRVVIILLAIEAKNTLKYRVDERLSRTECSGIDTGFSNIQTFCIEADDLQSRESLKRMIVSEIDMTRDVRGSRHSLLNGYHLKAAFHLAFHHFISTSTAPFDLVKATRQSRPVSDSLVTHLVHYINAGKSAGLTPHDLVPSISSAIFMDHYVPGAVVFEPRQVYHTLYQEPIQDVCKVHDSQGLAFAIEQSFLSLFDRFDSHTSSAEIRVKQLSSHKQTLCHVRTHRICLFCLLGVAQHTLACGHTLCDRCAQVFGTPTPGYDYRFTIMGCLYCTYERSLVVDTLGPTMSPSILAIDGGGVRGVIPLEFLLLVQEYLNPCSIQDLIDLGIGTSSGGLITQGLFIMRWSVPQCSQIFESLAHRIFSERRSSTTLKMIRIFTGSHSFLGESARWLSWLLRDSCYDARVFDDVLKETFGKHRRMFGPSRDDPRGQLHSGTRAGVVTTSISRDTTTFVISNFNSASRNEADHRVIRPIDTTDEPTVWKAARATAAAPFYFTPVDFPGVGSFQDGGLKHNFAGGIALEISHQVWPKFGGSARMLSLGTGITETSEDQTPHFRHIFQDSFLRRGFDAWMSTMDTEQDWRKYKYRLTRQGAFDSMRLNVPLGNTPNHLDEAARMEDYRNLVIAQPGSARMAREAATMLLVSRFYFTIYELPENTLAAPFWCRGVIRCKGNARPVISALEHLHPEGLCWVSDSGLLEKFAGQSGICTSCASYSHVITILSRHLDHDFSIFLEVRRKGRWRASGFPASIASIADRQHFYASFGREDHGKPNRVYCATCDISQVQSKRKRESRVARGRLLKRVRD